MRRLALLLLLTCVTPALATAGGFCMKLSLNNTDYTVVLDRLPKKPKPVAGYSATYLGGTTGGYVFIPVAGNGYLLKTQFPRLVIGLTEFGPGHFTSGSPTGSSTPRFVGISCNPGSDGKIGVGDACDGTYMSADAGFVLPLQFGQVVSCDPGVGAAPPLP